MPETGRTGPTVCAGGHVCTQFTDDGVGSSIPSASSIPSIPPRVSAKAPPLSICYGIVKPHGGDITANNAPEGGAVIEVRLPAAVAAAPETEAAKPAARQREGAIHGRALRSRKKGHPPIRARRPHGRRRNRDHRQDQPGCKDSSLSEAFDALIMNGKMPGQWTPRNPAPGSKRIALRWKVPSCSPSRMAWNKGPTRLPPGHNIPYLVKPFEVAELISQARKPAAKGARRRRV